jgi:hypothetical protein
MVMYRNLQARSRHSGSPAGRSGVGSHLSASQDPRLPIVKGSLADGLSCSPASGMGREGHHGPSLTPVVAEAHRPAPTGSGRSCVGRHAVENPRATLQGGHTGSVHPRRPAKSIVSTARPSAWTARWQPSRSARVPNVGQPPRTVPARKRQRLGAKWMRGRAHGGASDTVRPAACSPTGGKASRVREPGRMHW